MSRPIVIGLTGGAGTGKSTVSHELVRLYGFTRLAFADPLKAMLQIYLASYGMSAYQIQRHLDGDLKEAPCEALMGASCRKAQQTLGTEWGRQHMDLNIWTHHLVARVMSLMPEQRARVVIDDVRMDNEAETLYANFGLGAVEVWKVDPFGAPRRHPPTHASEVGIDPTLVSWTLHHNFTMPKLQSELDFHMKRLGIDKQGVWAE